MSLNFLPLQVYVSLCLFLSIALILIAVKRRNIDRKGLLVFYFISSAGGILAAIIRVLKRQPVSMMIILIRLAIFCLDMQDYFFADLFYLSVTQVIAKGDKEAKRKLIIG